MNGLDPSTTADDVAPLAAFLRSLTEDYESIAVRAVGGSAAARPIARSMRDS